MIGNDESARLEAEEQGFKDDRAGLNRETDRERQDEDLAYDRMEAAQDILGEQTAAKQSWATPFTGPESALEEVIAAVYGKPGQDTPADATVRQACDVLRDQMAQLVREAQP